MADFTALKTAIQNAIKQNGNEEITGAILQEVMLAVVSTLGDSAINDLVAALNTEVTNRQNADGTLQSNINAEQSARQLADSTLQSGINNERDLRFAADNALQNAINAINTKLAEGYVYVGIATTSTNPSTPSGKVFYIAVAAGTYTNFLNSSSQPLVLIQGINILKYNGTSWSVEQVWGVDDNPTAGSNKLVKSGGVFNDIMTNGSAFDLSAYNNGTTYADLNSALTALNALPAAYKRGGMSLKFVLTSDNKYVQCRLMAQSFTTNVTQWQGVDKEPVAGSKNLITSDAVIKSGSMQFFSRGGVVFDLENKRVTLKRGTHYLRNDRGGFSITLDSDTVYTLDKTTARYLYWDLDNNAIVLAATNAYPSSGNIAMLLAIDPETNIINEGLLREYYSYFIARENITDKANINKASVVPFGIGLSTRAGVTFSQSGNEYTITFKRGTHYIFSGTSAYVYAPQSNTSFTLTPDLRLLKYIISSQTVVATNETVGSGEVLLAYVDHESRKFENGLLYEHYLNSKIDSVEEGMYSDYFAIRPFFKAEMSKTIEDCNNVMSNDCFVATIVTDNHFVDTDVRARQNKDCLDNIKYFNSAIFNDALIHIGDIIGAEEYSVLQKTNVEIQADMGMYLAQLGKINNNTLVTNGNHDGDYGQIFTQSMWLATQGRADSYQKIVSNENSDFYWDCERAKLRLIFIALPGVNGWNGWQYSTTTLNWLYDTLSALEDGWNVIICSHIIPYCPSYDGYPLGNVDTFVGLCNAFNDHTTFSDSIISVDFSSFTTSKILCQLAGHTHSDKILAPGESFVGTWTKGGATVTDTITNTLNHPTVVFGCNWTNAQGNPTFGTIPPRTDKTVTQDLWTVMIYRPDQNKIYFKRFGAGDDYVINV